jgi:alkanesulfonate monooxygenase SsuD/methylene tetrahydromethanopterin reductase-like flavin-dependent oxidoreductase (luciferase family)
VRKSEILAGHCRDLGTDVEEIVRSANYNVVIGRDEAEVAERLRWIENHLSPHLSPEHLAATVETYRTGPLVGTPEQIATTLTELERLGMTYAITYFAEAAYDTSGVDLFVDEVVPALG